MKIHFYGTGASEGFPALFCECEYCRKARELKGKNIRTRTSVQIGDSILIDFSPDTYAHEVYGGLDLTRIKHLLITHSHSDHFYASDIVGIFPPMAETGPDRKLTVYGSSAVGDVLQNTLLRDYGTKLEFRRVESYQPLCIEDYAVMPVNSDHMKDEESHLYIIEREGKTLLFGHDSAMFPEDAWEEMKAWQFDCVIMDCTSVEKGGWFDTHMGLPDNIKVRERMLKEGMANDQTKFIATHFVHTFGPLHDRLTELFKPYGIIPAYDGMEIEI